MRRFPHKRRTRSAIQLTALIDMVFLLLIYFLLTSSFVEQEGVSINVPRVTATDLYSEKTIMVLIDKSGGFHLDQQAVSDQQLESLLRTYISLSLDKGVVVKADRQASYERVARVLDIARENGARQLHLAMEKKMPGKNKN